MRYKYSFNSLYKARYASLVKRSTGKDRYQHHYEGSGYPTFDEFAGWARQPENLRRFYKLWIEWVKSDFDVRFSPTIDRKDNWRGYSLDNIQWLSFSDNVKKGRADNYERSKLLPKKLCTIADCDTPAICRTYCEKHYTRWKRHKDPNADFSYLRGYGSGH